MGRTILGTLLVAGIVIAAVSAADPRDEVYGQRAAQPKTAPAATAGTELIVVSTSVGEKCLMLTVVDPRQQVISVYHIETATGKISLKSVRNIQWDMKITDLNNENPLPRDIRSLLDQR